MKEIQIKELIKLGTAVRYLVDVKYKMSDKYTADEPLGDDHVIDNISVVLKLVSKFDITDTAESGAFIKLRKLHDKLKTESRTNTVISLEHAERLSGICRIIRGSLHTEGNSKLAYYLEPEEIDSATSPGWPKDVTLQHVLNAPKNIRKLVMLILGSAFAIGIAFGETGITVDFFSSLIPKQEVEPHPQSTDNNQQGVSNKVVDGDALDKLENK